MTTIPSTTSIASSLEATIHKAVQDIAKETQELAIKEAVSNYEIQLRKAVGNIAISLVNFYSVERVGNELLIHVKLEQK